MFSLSTTPPESPFPVGPPHSFLALRMPNWAISELLIALLTKLTFLLISLPSQLQFTLEDLARVCLALGGFL